MNKHILWPGLALTISLFLGACSLLPLGTASETPTADVASPAPARASIHGRVWQDRCGLADGTLGPNCVPLSDGRYRADGVIQSNEPGLGGVTVALGPSCPAAPIIRAVTAADGSFAFEGLPAGLYCLTVDPGWPGNEMITAGQGADKRIEVDPAVRLRGQTPTWRGPQPSPGSGLGGQGPARDELVGRTQLSQRRFRMRVRPRGFEYYALMPRKLRPGVVICGRSRSGLLP